MMTFVFSLLMFVLVVAALGIGVALGREPLRGSCGGLSGSACASCERPCAQHRKQSKLRRD